MLPFLKLPTAITSVARHQLPDDLPEILRRLVGHAPHGKIPVFHDERDMPPSFVFGALVTVPGTKYESSSSRCPVFPGSRWASVPWFVTQICSMPGFLGFDHLPGRHHPSRALAPDPEQAPGPVCAEHRPRHRLRYPRCPTCAGRLPLLQQTGSPGQPRGVFPTVPARGTRESRMSCPQVRSQLLQLPRSGRAGSSSPGTGHRQRQGWQPLLQSCRNP